MAITNVSQTSTFGGIGLGPNADGVFVMGGTNDLLYGGDVSNDVAGDGLTVVSADGDQHFGLAVYADENDTALTAGWVSTIFGSMKTYNAITGSPNVSAFGVTGQMHVGASLTSIGNICGVYGIAETVSGVTIGAQFFGGLFGASLPSGATINTSYACGGIIIGGSYGGTTTGDVLGIYFQNPGTGDFDGIFGLDSRNVTDGAVGGSNTKKIKVRALVGGTWTTYYIPLNTS